MQKKKRIIPEIHQSTTVFKTFIFLKGERIEVPVISLDSDENVFQKAILLSSTEPNSIYVQYDYFKVTLNKRSATGKGHLSICESVVMSVVD